MLQLLQIVYHICGPLKRLVGQLTKDAESRVDLAVVGYLLVLLDQIGQPLLVFVDLLSEFVELGCDRVTAHCYNKA